MRRYLLLLLTLVLGTSCVPQKQWRTKPVLSSPSAPANLEDGFFIGPDAAKNRLYSLSFVEFGNDGRAWNPLQLDEALKAIDEADRRSNHHALVLVFIHGWKNNAGQSNNNVVDFRKQINRMASDVCGKNIATCGVAGIYFGWNGDAVKREWGTLRQASLFDRRGVARQVASGDIGKSLLAVMKRVKEGPGREGNRSVMVGHSFGGLILEAAIAPKLKQAGDEIHDQIGKNRANLDAIDVPALRELADLIVLINQASPAVQAVNLLADYRQDLQQVHFLLPPRKLNCAPGDTNQDCKSLTRPLIMAISSESDLATSTLLPISEKLSPSKLKLNPGIKLPDGLDEKKVSTTASAHTPQLYSHHLVECDGEDCAPCLKRDRYYIPIRIDKLPAFARGNETHKDRRLNYCLERDFRAWNQTPYWVFRLPTAIVPDHSEIFTDRFTDFLTAFLPPLGEVQKTLAPNRPTTKVGAGR